jgi:hypothetical protein
MQRRCGMDGVPDVSVRIPLDGTALPGNARFPPDSLGLVIFAHGNGSGRRARGTTMSLTFSRRLRSTRKSGTCCGERRAGGRKR